MLAYLADVCSNARTVRPSQYGKKNEHALSLKCIYCLVFKSIISTYPDFTFFQVLNHVFLPDFYMDLHSRPHLCCLVKNLSAMECPAYLETEAYLESDSLATHTKERPPGMPRCLVRRPVFMCICAMDSSSRQHCDGARGVWTTILIKAEKLAGLDKARIRRKGRLECISPGRLVKSWRLMCLIQASRSDKAYRFGQAPKSVSQHPV